MKQCNHKVMKEESSGLYKYCTKCPYKEWYDEETRLKWSKVKDLTNKISYYKSCLVQYETIKIKKSYDDYFNKRFVDNQIKVLTDYIEKFEKEKEELKNG